MVFICLISLQLNLFQNIQEFGFQTLKSANMMQNFGWLNAVFAALTDVNACFVQQKHFSQLFFFQNSAYLLFFFKEVVSSPLALQNSVFTHQMFLCYWSRLQPVPHSGHMFKAEKQSAS